MVKLANAMMLPSYYPLSKFRHTRKEKVLKVEEKNVADAVAKQMAGYVTTQLLIKEEQKS